MAFFQAISKLGTTQTFADAFGAADITTPEMQRAIVQWHELYYRAIQPKQYNSAQRIPYTIVDGIHTAAFGEYTCNIDEQNGKGDNMKTVLSTLEKKRAELFQSALIGGECFIKPVVRRNSFAFSTIGRMGFIVLARDVEGNITSICTSEASVHGKHYHTLLERRTVDDNGFLTIESKLYRSTSRDVLGMEVSLADVEAYASLAPVVTLPRPLWNLGLIPLKTPNANCVDGSPDGVSVYAAATDKILTQYKHERRTEDEYEVTVPALYMSEDEFQIDEKGDPIIPKFAHAIDDDPKNVGRFTYNPTPNQEPLEKRANQNLRDIENLIGLRRGFLCCVDSEERTATEVLSSSTKFAHVITSLQEMWGGAVTEVVRTCDILGQTYLGWNSSECPSPILDWGNGVLYDEEKDFQRNYQLTTGGYQKPEILVGWLHGMPYDTPEQQQEIREKYMPESNASAPYGELLFPPGEDEA